VKRPMTLRSLKAHLKRSKYSLDVAIISLRAALDLQKKTFITRNCKNLQRLEIRGNGVIGESLTKSLPHAKSLNTLYVSRSCAITFSAVQECLKACRSTITEATFLEVTGVMFPDRDLQLDHLKKLTLKTRRDNPPLLAVSSTFPMSYHSSYAPTRNTFSRRIAQLFFTTPINKHFGIELAVGMASFPPSPIAARLNYQTWIVN